MDEKTELLHILRVMWRRGDSSLRRIYPSWEDLEANMDIIVEVQKRKTEFELKPCPYCGVTQKILKPLDELFPYEKCRSCKRAFHVNNNLSVRKLSAEEREDMPAEWVRILEDLKKKKMAIVFKLE